MFPGFPMLAFQELRQAIINKADPIRSLISPTSEHGKYVSLMADGVRAGRRLWQGVCRATMPWFLFWRVIQIPSQTSADTAEGLAIVVRELVVRGFACCGVVFDNAANEKKALNAKTAASLQRFTGTCLIPVPCFSHTLNLGIQHIMHKCIPGRDPVEGLRTMIHIFPKNKCGDEFYGIPTTVKTHWLCIGEMTDYIAPRYSGIHQLMTSMTFTARSAEHAEAIRLFQGYNFRDLSECCTVVNNLIRCSETEATRLYMVWSTVAVICEQIDHLTQSGNMYTHLFNQCLQARLTKTEGIGELLFSFILTPNRLKWYHSLPEILPDGNPQMSKKSVRTTVAELRKFFRIKFGAGREVWDTCWDSYLTSESTASSGTVTELRTRRLGL
jgi:hypothetical protein